MSTTNYDKLIRNLDAFIRKYYLNKSLRGLLYWVGFALVLYLVMSLLESQFWFSAAVRKGMLAGFVLMALGTFAYWVAKPLLSFFSLGSQISHEQAADIVGSHFANVKDKLLNVLQLKNQAIGQQDSSLLMASIEQKTSDLKVVRFPEAIDLTKNKKYLKYAIPPLLLLLLLLIGAPYLITDSTARILDNNREYTKPAPFSFHIDESKLNVLQYSDTKIDVTIEGDVTPDEAYIKFGEFQYKLKKEGVGKFSYYFKNVQESKEFSFNSGSVVSRPYQLDVIGKPNIESYALMVDYPVYTGRKDETVENVTDLIVPEGTSITWNLNTIHTDKVEINGIKDTTIVLMSSGTPSYKVSQAIYKQTQATFLISGNNVERADSLSYQILTIPDKYPQIKVKQFKDTTNQDAFIFFAGEASDDYGIRSLRFKYNIESQDGKRSETQSIPVKTAGRLSTQFDFEWDPTSIQLKPGEKVSYYFEVYDNDGVNGSKSARSVIMTMEKPSIEEIEKLEEDNEQAIMEQLEKSFKDSKELEKEIEKLKNKLLTKKEMDWQDKKELEKLIQKKQELLEKLKEAKKKFDENRKNQENQEPPSEELQQKEDKLEEVFEKLDKDTEMEELLKKIQELMQEDKKEDALDKLEEMQQEQKKQDMDIDRLKELFKQLELEKEVEKQLDKLNDLSEKQEKLAEETEKGEKSKEELLKEQEEINKEFDKIKKEIDKVEEKNQKLSKPQDLGNPQKDMHDIQDDLDKGTEQLQQDNNQKAAEKQKDAAKKMKQMEESMSGGMAGGQQEQMSEDIQMLRQLLENLVNISFEQEDLINRVGNSDAFSQNYVRNVQSQFKLQDDFSIVEDSLRALSKRVFQLEAFIMEKVIDINKNFKQTVSHLEEREIPQARSQQQKAMTNVNDLAVMLSETMEQMQMQMASSMPGNQMCNKPGMGKKPKSSGDKPGSVPMDKISEGQQKLNEAMKKMAEDNKKKGQKGKPGEGEGGQSSEEFAKMAQEQAQLRKMLRDFQKDLQEQGKGNQALEDILKDMDKNETQLVNKKLTNEMLKRQEDILTRLLESDRAERQRKMDEKRKAETAKVQQNKEMPPALKEYLKKRGSEIEGLRSVSPQLLPFYKDLVEDYYNTYGTY